jgi:hypothetical protein
LFAPDSGSLHIRELLSIPEKFFDNPSVTVDRDYLGGLPGEFVGEKIFGSLFDGVNTFNQPMLSGYSI